MLVGCGPGMESNRECYSIARFKRLHAPFFDQYFVNVRGNGKSRIDVYTQLPFRNIRFEKKGSIFAGSYTMRVAIRDSNGMIVRTADADRPIEAGTYEHSVSRRSDLFLQSFQLEPGRYLFEIESFDHLSKHRYRTNTIVTASDLSSGTVRAGTPLFLNTMRISESGVTLSPVLPTDLSTLTDSIGIFQEIYHCSENDTVRIIQEFIRPREDAKSELIYPRMMPPYRSLVPSCRTGGDEQYFKAETVFTVKAVGTIQSILFYPKPVAGSNTIRRSLITTKDGKCDTLISETRMFRREKRPSASTTLDEEISVLRFIIQQELFDSLLAADAAGRNRLLREFWDARGGPEQRKEFLRRIAESTMLFTGSTLGSSTPMGIISVICGIPDMIDCSGEETETWHYAIGERSYPIQFRKTDGNHGTYELDPFTVSDILWQYSLDRWRRKR